MNTKIRFAPIALVIGGLMAATLPSAALAQNTGEGTVVFANNTTCDLGQGSERAMSPCAMDENGLVGLEFTNPQDRTGPFEGVQFLQGSGGLDPTDGSFEGGGYSYFAGEVEGCGTGTVYFDWEVAGAMNAEGLPTFTVNRYTSTPGGSLAVTATMEELATETPNGDGTSTIPYTVEWSCDAA